jgi:hypothetical protein
MMMRIGRFGGFAGAEPCSTAPAADLNPLAIAAAPINAESVRKLRLRTVVV